MRGLYYRLSPFTPDSAGAAAVFADLPVLIIPLDMNGTVSTFRNRVGVQPDSRVRVCSILNNRELSYVMGLTDDFAEECQELMGLYEHDFTVLLHGPVSSMVGLDLDCLAADLEHEEGKPVIAVDCSGNEPYERGIASALEAIFRRVPNDPCETLCGSYNLLGLNSVDHNDLALRRLIGDSVAAVHAGECVSVWGSGGGWEQWNRARAAAENVVVSVSALPLARAMEREWGISWKSMDQLGLFSCAGAGDRWDGLEVLVVSEQILGNTVRDALGKTGLVVTVATFHTLDEELSREGDCVLDSERELTQLLDARGFDVVIGDVALASCLTGQVFCELPHSAISHVALEYSGPTVLSGEWFTSLSITLSRASCMGTKGDT